MEPFPTDDWRLIERFAQEGILKQEVWSSRLQWLGVKAKIEIPLSGTGFNVRQNTLRIENLPESWPMDTESAWRERYWKISLFRTLLHICEKIALLMTFLKDMKIQINSPRLILADSGSNVCHAWTVLLFLSMGHCILAD